MERIPIEQQTIQGPVEGNRSIGEFFPNGNPLLAPALQPDLTGLYLSIAVAVSLAMLAIGVAVVAVWKSRK